MRLAWLALVGCGSMRTIIAPSGDLADYREFCVAAHEGTRLKRAQTYLARHPNGSFAVDVRKAFEIEELAYFAKAQASQEAARRYLADLPDGPHAPAALALLVAFDSSMEDAELRDLARKVRYEDVTLEAAAKQRRAVGDAILSAVGVLLDDASYGSSRTTPPISVLLGGRIPSTIGGIPTSREDDYFFLLPTRPQRESRLLTLVTSVREVDGLVIEGAVEGSDMFVRWAEADEIVKLDPASPNDRTEAFVHAHERLAGALEARFPSTSCPEQEAPGELLHRRCAASEGWEVVVTTGGSAGDRDSIVIRGKRSVVR